MGVNAKELRIVYMGTPDFAVAPLRKLVESGYNIVAVVTAVDKPAGRGLKLQESAVKQYAASVGIPVLQPEKLKAPEFVAEFEALNADLGIVIAFRMLPEIIWANPRLGTFNLHASLLPQYRGAAPINWAVINGEKISGITTFMLNHEIDKGDVLGRSEVAITDEDSAGTLHDKLMNEGVELVVETVEKIASGSAVAIVQHEMEQGLAHEAIKDAPKIFKADCKIDWSKGVQQVNNLIRGLSPYPTAWTNAFHSEGCDAVSVKIFESHYEYFENSEHKEVCGSIVSDGKKQMKVACADGYLFIDDLQVSGKRRMAICDFLRGSAPFVRMEI